MEKVKALTLEEIKNMDGEEVFTAPIIGLVSIEEPWVTFNPLYKGLGFHRVDVNNSELIRGGCFWSFEQINNPGFGCVVFKEEVTEKEAQEAWEEMRLNGVVR